MLISTHSFLKQQHKIRKIAKNLSFARNPFIILPEEELPSQPLQYCLYFGTASMPNIQSLKNILIPNGYLQLCLCNTRQPCLKKLQYHLQKNYFLHITLSSCKIYIDTSRLLQEYFHKKSFRCISIGLARKSMLL